MVAVEAFTSNPTARQVLAIGSHAMVDAELSIIYAAPLYGPAHSAPDPAASALMGSAAAPAPSPSAEPFGPPAPTAPADPTAGPAPAPPGAEAPAPAGRPRDPTAIESTFGAMRPTADMQRRQVFVGDPALESFFYSKMAVTEQVDYKGSVPHLQMATDKAIKEFTDAANEYGELAGKKEAVTKALDFTMDRPSGIVAGLANKVGLMQDRAVVLVADTTCADTMKEVSAFAKTPGDRKLLATTLPASFSADTWSDDPAVQVAGNSKLYQVAALAAEVVQEKEAVGAAATVGGETPAATPKENPYARG